MKRALHIYAVNGKTNSGDFFLGPSTKWEFENIVGEDVRWYNFDVRRMVNHADVKYFNDFDYVVIGGGGLFLPDTNPNKTSCWQWACRADFIEQIKAKIYVVGIGWNHFYGQDITMPNRGNSVSDPERLKIFKNNVETLVRKSTNFTMRHQGDCDRLKEIIDVELHDKVQFEFCPVVGYVESKFSKDFTSGEYMTFEIKDDRPNRRYIGKKRDDFYAELHEYINHLISEGEKIAVMSHDGSMSFVSYLKNRGVPFLFLNNTVANQEAIIQNYSKVKKLFCTAGHSQMTAHALNLEYYSLINNDKLKYFLEDNNIFTSENYCLINEEKIGEKLI